MNCQKCGSSTKITVEYPELILCVKCETDLRRTDPETARRLAKLDSEWWEKVKQGKGFPQRRRK